MNNNILDDAQNQSQKLALAILNCYGLHQVSKNVSEFVNDEEITAWYIEDLPKEVLESKSLSYEEIIELYNLAV